MRFNCAAISPDLAEAELFGHARGAFTGANHAREGWFTRAHRGTLVLDEVGELPERVQPKLLRALQSGEVQRVGSSQLETVDVRVVACTHRDLAAEARAGRFREDLYFRLAVLELHVPSLADRVDDVPALARALARRAAERFGMEHVHLGDDVLARLTCARWPGNVRQLENTVTRLVALSSGGDVHWDDAALGDAPQGPSVTDAAATGQGLKSAVSAYEREIIASALRAAGGNQSETARRLGVSRVTLIDKLKRYGLV